MYSRLNNLQLNYRSDEGGGGDAELLDKIDRGITALDGKIKSGDLRFEDLSKRTKGIMEDLTKLKGVANDTHSNHIATIRKISELERAIGMDKHDAYGNPIARIQRDEELRTRFNLAIRLAVDQGGDMLRSIKNGFQGDLVKRALGEDSSPGSTLIDDRLASEIYDTLPRYGMFSTFAVRRLTTKQTKFPVSTARPVANVILTEGGTVADDTNKAGTVVTLEVEAIATLLHVSLQLLEDAEFDVTSNVLEDFAQATALRIDHFCLGAAGAANATDGGMTGVFGGGGTAAVADTGDVSVETLELNDFIRCLTTVDPVVLTRKARWWLHPSILVRCLAIVDGNGRPIFQTALEAPAPGAIGSILGYPVTLSHAAPSTNTVNSKVAVFGDPEGQVVGIRTDFKFEASDHHRWNTLERSFRGYGRAGTKIRRSQAFAVLTLAAA